MVTGVAGKHTKIEKTTASRESGFQLSRYLLWNVYDRTGIKRANIARLESKKHSVTLESLIKYAECLNMDIKIELRPKQHNESN